MRLPRLTVAGLWTVVAIAIPALGSTVASLSTVDLAYQVRAGDLTIAAGDVLRTDPFTFSAAGGPWLNQQWGAQVLFAVVHGAAGWAGLALLRTMLVGLAFGLVLAACRAAGAGPRGAALLTLGGFLVALPALALRAQLLGIVLFAATLLVLAGRRRRPRATWLVPFLVLAWVSVHGSFVLGPAALAAAWLADAVAGRAGGRRLALALLASLMATLVNPFGLDAWRYLIGVGANAEIARLVSEWQRTSPLAPAGAVFYLSVVAAGAFLGLSWRRGARSPWPELAWLAGLVALGAWAERGIAWWALAAPVALSPLVAGLVPRFWAEAGPPAGRGAAANTVLAVLLGLAIVALQPAWRPSDPMTGPAGLLSDAPGPLAVALRGAAGPGDRVFNPQRWGSWLEWAAPGIPLMVDSRIEVIPEAAWDDYLAISAGVADWRDRLDRLGVTVVVASRMDQAALLPLLAADPGWRRIYQDGDAELYVRAP